MGYRRDAIGVLGCLSIGAFFWLGLLVPGASWAQDKPAAALSEPEPPVPPARLEFESVSTTGGVPEDEALWRLESQTRLMACYGDSEGEVDYYGRVTAVKTTKNELGAAFVSCAEEAWWAARLSQPKEYPATITLHYTFTPERENE